MLDLDDASKTENTRAAYPLKQIANAHPDKRAGHPTNVVMLTADAFGVLPPIARLDRDQALYYFLSGYTAKVAGTEIGVTEPQPTFSHVLRRAVHAAATRPCTPRCSASSSTRTASAVWLVNTGWTGGPFGEGERMPIAATRALLHAALSGHARRRRVPQPTRSSAFGCRSRCPGVDSKLLDPRSTWRDPETYDRKARELAQMFRENFEKFPPELAAAGPVA